MYVPANASDRLSLTQWHNVLRELRDEMSQCEERHSDDLDNVRYLYDDALLRMSLQHAHAVMWTLSGGGIVVRKKGRRRRQPFYIPRRAAQELIENNGFDPEEVRILKDLLPSTQSSGSGGKNGGNKGYHNKPPRTIRR